MIRTLDNKNKNKQMIRVNEYEALKQKLTAAEFTAITDEIDKLVNESNGKFVPSWQDIDWSDAVFKPLVNTCGGDVEMSSKFYGLICWDVIRQRSEVWTYTKFEQNGRKYSMYFL